MLHDSCLMKCPNEVTDEIHTAGARVVDVCAGSFEYCSRSSRAVFQNVPRPVTRQGFFSFFVLFLAVFCLYFLSEIGLGFKRLIRGFVFLRCLKVPTQFASRQTAEDMALMAYNRAIVLSNPGCWLCVCFPNVICQKLLPIDVLLLYLV